MIARVLLWGLFDSKTTFEELQAKLPDVEPPSAWIWNEASERFGLICFGDELPAGLAEVGALIGRDAEVYEEFDTLE